MSANDALTVLDEQVRLILWWRTPFGQSFGRGFTEDKRSKGELGHTGSLDRIEEGKLDRAPTYWVSPDMQTVFEHAADSMPAQPLQADDLPSPYGFVWLARPWVNLDVHAIPCSTRAFAWGPANVAGGGRGIHLSQYTDLDHPAEGELALTDLRLMRRAHSRLVLLDEQGWVFGANYTGARDIDDPGIDDATRAAIVEGGLQKRRQMASLWALMTQRLTECTTIYIPRTRHKPAAAAMAVPPEVIVVDLRRVERPSATDAATRPVNWTHRWMVDGHWRNQWLPSVRAHRLQWISPYVKGPDDRPLVIKDRVYRVVR